MSLLLAAGILAGACLVFTAGLCLGSALANQRFYEHCARCASIIRHSKTPDD